MNNILNLLAFCAKYPGWHTLAKDRATQDAKRSLIKRGYLKENEHKQVIYIRG